MSYVTLKNYIENFSLFGSLTGGSRNLSLDDKCWCTSTIYGKKINKCYPMVLCRSCNINLSGQCSQHGPDLGPGV